MTVRELKEVLGRFDDNAYVCLAKNSRWGSEYAHDVSGVSEDVLRPFFGSDEDVVVVHIGEQVGAV